MAAKRVREEAVVEAVLGNHVHFQEFLFSYVLANNMSALYVPTAFASWRKHTSDAPVGVDESQWVEATFVMALPLTGLPHRSTTRMYVEFPGMVGAFVASRDTMAYLVAAMDVFREAHPQFTHFLVLAIKGVPPTSLPLVYCAGTKWKTCFNEGAVAEMEQYLKTCETKELEEDLSDAKRRVTAVAYMTSLVSRTVMTCDDGLPRVPLQTVFEKVETHEVGVPYTHLIELLKMAVHVSVYTE